MGAKQSKEMDAAKVLVLSGMSPYEAAKKTGITSQAIYAAKWYKELNNETSPELQSAPAK